MTEYNEEDLQTAYQEGRRDERKRQERAQSLSSAHGSIIYGVRYKSDSGATSIRAYYAKKEDAVKNAKERGSAHGDYSHHAYEHSVEDITILSNSPHQP